MWPGSPVVLASPHPSYVLELSLFTTNSLDLSKKTAAFSKVVCGHSGKVTRVRLQDQSWRLQAFAARMIFLFHMCLIPTVRRFDYGLRTWDTTVKLIWMEKDKHAIEMETKITIIRKIFVITEEYFACTHLSSLWQALQEKRSWKRGKKREKKYRDRQGEREKIKRETEWILLTCHSTTLAFN